MRLDDEAQIVTFALVEAELEEETTIQTADEAVSSADADQE